MSDLVLVGARERYGYGSDHRELEAHLERVIRSDPSTRVMRAFSRDNASRELVDHMIHAALALEQRRLEIIEMSQDTMTSTERDAVYQSMPLILELEKGFREMLTRAVVLDELDYATRVDAERREAP